MLLNNLELDFKTKCIEQQVTQTKIAEEIGTSKSYLTRLIKGRDNIVSNMFVKAVEALGYDIKIHYVKRKKGRSGNAKV